VRIQLPVKPVFCSVAPQTPATGLGLGFYANRDETRREHSQAILERLGLKQFDRIAHLDIAKWLLPIVLQTTQGLVLAQASSRNFEGVALSCLRFW
jgi:Domain of unknown function (DUF4158)